MAGTPFYDVEKGFIPDTKCIIASIPMSGASENWQIGRSADEWQSYVESHQLFSPETDFSYQRTGSYIRFPANADDLYANGANYVAWQNTYFNNKWFYAFITGLEYRNPNVTWVHIAIDVINTWIYDCAFSSCFAEQWLPESDEYLEWLNGDINYNPAHSLTYARQVITATEFGTSLEPSDVGQGEHFGTFLSFKEYGWLSQLYTTKMDGIPYALGVTYCRTIDALKQVLNLLNQQDNWDTLVAGWVAPINRLYYNDDDGYYYMTHGLTTSVNAQIPVGDLLPPMNSGNNSYKPNNYKMYSYPYTSCGLENGAGDTLLLAWEKFANFSSSGSMVIAQISASLQNPCLPVIRAYQYANSTGHTDNLYSLSLGQLPTLSLQQVGLGTQRMEFGLGLAEVAIGLGLLL